MSTEDIRFLVALRESIGLLIQFQSTKEEVTS